MKTTLWVLLFLCTSVLCAEVLFYDDFNRIEGESVGNNWVNIGPVNPIIENGAMKIVSSSLQGARRDFTSLGITSGVYYASWDWKVSSNSWLADAFPNGTITYLRHDYEGNLYYDNTSDFSNPTTIGSLAPDTWANFKLKVNIDTDRFSLWINNTLVADNIAGLAVTDFSCFTFRAGSGSTVTQYIDNFIVYNDIPPASPTNLTAIGTVNDISLSWTGSPQDFLTYKIYRKTSSPADVFLAEVPGTQTSYTDLSAAANTDYFYRVKAVSMSTIESAFSNEATGHLRPQASVTPTNLVFNAGQSLSGTATLSINNSGNYPLDYTIQVLGQMYGNGTDGDLDVPSGTYYTDAVKSPLIGYYVSGVTQITVENSSGMASGDEILIITMQDTNTENNTAGQYEFHRILSISNNQIILTATLQNTFSQSSKSQVIRIPNYRNVTNYGTLTCSPWNGSTGGVLCFRVYNCLNNYSIISANGCGFEGGHAPGAAYNNGCSGGGFYRGSVPYSAVPNGNGGAGGNWQGYPYWGGNGLVVGNPEMTRLILGGGGGGGATPSTSSAGDGGAGGGVIVLSSRHIGNNGSISTHGNAGVNPNPPYYGNPQRVGGSGAGGFVLINSSSLVNNGSIGADGGALGKIRFNVTDLTLGNVYPSPYTSFNNSTLIENISCFEPYGVVQGQSQRTLTFSVNTVGIPLGSYQDSITILTSDEDNPSVSIPILVNSDSTAPLVPLGLVFDEVQSDMNQIYISWTANALADSVYSYKVFRRGLHDTLWSLKGTVDADHNWFIDNQFTGLDTIAVYYKITAIDWVDNESTASEEVMAWLQRFPAPTGLAMEIIRNRHVQLTWNPVTQTISGNPGTPSCYVIYRSNAPSPIEDFYYVGAVDATTFTHDWAAWFIEIGKQFYVVTAYSGSFEDLRAVADSRREWKYGELEEILNSTETSYNK